MIKDINKIKINKNRGWRGLVEAVVYNNEGESATAVFSFSPETWQDLMTRNRIVLQDEENFYVLTIDNDDVTNKLPIGHQRSVLIKNFIGNVVNTKVIKKAGWQETSREEEDVYLFYYITHFKKNQNNHTTSSWNNIGIRVTPISIL